MSRKFEVERPKERAKWYTEASGDADGAFYIEIDILRNIYQRSYGLGLARLLNAEITFYSGDRSEANIKAYHESARDCDHWLHRVFDARIEELRVTSIDYGVSEYTGYLSELYAYQTGEGPEISAVEKCESCGKVHGWVDTHLPPAAWGVDEDYDGDEAYLRMPVKVRVYPTKAFKPTLVSAED